MNAPLDGPVRFGAFQLDPRTGELRKAGARISLPEQPLQVLKALLNRPGDLVTREELRQRLWPADTFVDFEHGLNAAVRRLRDALGDSADVPRFVETLPRRGYRFIAPVTGLPAGDEPAEPRPAIEDGRGGVGTPGQKGAPWRLIRAWGPLLVAAISVVVSRNPLEIRRPVLAAVSPDSGIRAIHAGCAPLREPHGRSGPGAPRRRDDRRTDRPVEQDGSVAPRGHRPDVGHAVQENHETNRPDWFRAGRGLPARGERPDGREPDPHRSAADRSPERKSPVGGPV